MVKHVVMWTLKDKKQAVELKGIIESMKGRVPSIVDLECGINYNPSQTAFDLVLISIHKSKADLADYQDDPVHLKIKDRVAIAATAAHVVDFEF